VDSGANGDLLIAEWCFMRNVRREKLEFTDFYDRAWHKLHKLSTGTARISADSATNRDA
jgi:hypothetical protein